MSRVGIFLQLYNIDLLDEFYPYLERIHKKFVETLINIDLCQDTADPYLIKYIKSCGFRYEIHENRGLDVLPFLLSWNKYKHGLDYVVKIHSKKSVHLDRGIGESWRKELYLPLIGTVNTLERNIDAFETNEHVHFIGARNNIAELREEPQSQLEKIYFASQQLGLPYIGEGSWVRGTMFMVRNNYLKWIFRNVEINNLIPLFEPGYQNDLTFAHSLERMFCSYSDYYNQNVIKKSKKDRHKFNY